MSQDSRSVSIPTWLYRKIEQRISAGEFNSVSDYVCFVLTHVVSEAEKDHDSYQTYSAEEEEKIKDRLKALGYL